MGILSAPKVDQIRSRRWVVFIAAIIENMLFAAPLFGWASLRGMLMDFGWKVSHYFNISLIEVNLR